MSEVEPKPLVAPSLGDDLGEVERGVLLLRVRARVGCVRAGVRVCGGAGYGGGEQLWTRRPSTRKRGGGAKGWTGVGLECGGSGRGRGGEGRGARTIRSGSGAGS